MTLTMIQHNKSILKTYTSALSKITPPKNRKEYFLKQIYEADIKALTKLIADQEFEQMHEERNNE